MHPDSPIITREESESVSCNEKGVLTSLRDHQTFTASPVVTQVEPQVSYRNWRKPTRFHLHCKMMPDSPALPPEQFRVTHQTRRETWLPLWNSREFPEPSQVQRNPEVTATTRKRYVYRNHLEMKSDLWLRIKRNVNFPQAPQEQASLSYRYGRGTLSILAQVIWTLRCPDSK